MNADLFLTPLSSDLRQQRRALALLTQLLDRTERRMYDDKPLPPMCWTISSTGVLIAEPVLPEAEVARPSYEAWSAELGIVERQEHTRDGVTYLRAPGTVDGLHVTIKAKIYAPIDTGEG